MRVLETHLEEALNAEAEPYLQLQYCISAAFTWINAPYPMFSYKLGGLEFNLHTAGTTIYSAYAIRLLRGAYWHKTPHYVPSSIYYVNKIIISQKEQVEIQATIIPRGNNFKYSINGNQTYQTIIDAICTQFGYTAAYESPAAAFWDNIFYPAGRTLTLQSPHSFFTLLRQKLFIYAADYNDNVIVFRQWIDDGLVGTGGHPDLETIVTFDWNKKYSFQSRTLLWRDENSTTHWYPDPVDFPNRPIYNMGYIESTAATPTCSQSWRENEDKRTFHLKYQDGDIINCSSGDYQIKVYEVFNRKESPSLYTQFVALPKFSTTEGGPLPSTIEAAAPYTPLNVSPFVLNLNSTDNNLQALAEAVDELTCGPAIYAASEKTTPVDADKFPLVDSTTTTHLVRWFSWVNLKARLKIYFDSFYWNSQPQVLRQMFTIPMLDNTATSVFRITTYNESGVNGGGCYSIFVHALVTDGLFPTSNVTAVKSFTAQFCRTVGGNGTGINSAVSEVVLTASAALGAASRDVGAVTMTVLETSEYLIDVQFTVDHTGASSSQLVVTIEVELVWIGFLKPPVMSQL